MNISAVKPHTARRLKRADSKATAAAGERAKLDHVVDMMRKPGGTCLTAVMAATGWKTPTARGQISVGVSKLLKPGEVIWTRRGAAGVTHYAILGD